MDDWHKSKCFADKTTNNTATWKVHLFFQKSAFCCFKNQDSSLESDSATTGFTAFYRGKVQQVNAYLLSSLLHGWRANERTLLTSD